MNLKTEEKLEISERPDFIRALLIVTLKHAENIGDLKASSKNTTKVSTVTQAKEDTENTT